MVTVTFQYEVTTEAMTDFLFCIWNSYPLQVEALCFQRGDLGAAWHGGQAPCTGLARPGPGFAASDSSVLSFILWASPLHL